MKKIVPELPLIPVAEKVIEAIKLEVIILIICIMLSHNITKKAHQIKLTEKMS